MEVISERPTNLVEVRASLENIKQKEELNFRAEKTLDYVQSVAQLDQKSTDSLKADLEKLNISRLKDIHIHKIIDILPKTVDDVKVISQSFSVNLSQDAMKKIADAVKSHVK